MNSFSVNSTFSKAQGKMCLLALVEKTCSKKLVKNAWNWRFCAFSTSSVKNVVESKAYQICKDFFFEKMEFLHIFKILPKKNLNLAAGSL